MESRYLIVTGKNMESVGIRQLKKNVSKYLKDVENDKKIIVGAVYFPSAVTLRQELCARIIFSCFDEKLHIASRVEQLDQPA